MVSVLTCAVAASLCAGGPADPPPAVHSQAIVNDPRSHGAIGDGLLSLAEAIWLTNKQLSSSALSAAEIAQLAGFGTDISFCDIDVSLAPVITCERDLPRIIDTPHGFQIKGAGGIAVIDLRDTRGIVADSDFVDFKDLELRGGEYGIHVRQADTPFGTQIENLRFTGQSNAGLKLSFTQPIGHSQIVLEKLAFDSLRTAISIDDLGPDRSGSFDMNAVTIRGCQIGIDWLLGARGGLTILGTRVSITGGEHALRIRNQVGGRRDVTFEGRFLELEGAGSALAIEADATGRTRMLLQASELTSGGRAIDIGPVGARLELVAQDTRIHGDVALGGGGTGGRVTLHNVHGDGGTMTVGASAGTLQFDHSLFSGVMLQSSGSVPIAVDDCRWIGGGITGTAAAPVTITASHGAGTSIGPNTTVVAPRTAAHLGSMDAAPLRPALGTVLTLAVDLPPKLGGLFLLGPVISPPAIGPNGTRVYANLGQSAVIPVLVSGQQVLPLPIPNLAGLAGLELWFQLVATPDATLPAPSPWLPPGRRVILR